MSIPAVKVIARMTRVMTVAWLTAGTAAAQTAPAPAKGAAPASSSASPAKPSAAAPEAYTYDPGGRRDPFVDLLGAGLDARAQAAKRGEGAAGLTVAEVSVRGVMQSRGAMLAMVEGPDKKTLLVHPGDKFADGTIKAITPQGLVVVQEVNDPLSLVKQREVRKLLRSLEDAKQ